MTTAESVDGEIIRMYSDYLLFEKRVSRKTRDAYAYEASVLLSYARERGVDVSTLDFDALVSFMDYRKKEAAQGGQNGGIDIP